MEIKKKTNVTIVSINLNDNILNSFSDYYIFKEKLDIKDIKLHDKFIFFNSLQLLNKNNKEKLIEYLKINKKKFIIITNNMEEVLLTDYLIVIDMFF